MSLIASAFVEREEGDKGSSDAGLISDADQRSVFLADVKLNKPIRECTNITRCSGDSTRDLFLESLRHIRREGPSDSQNSH